MGEVIVFKCDAGIYNRLLYIDLREHAEGLVMLETVEKNIEMFTKREIERAQLADVLSTVTMCAPHGRMHEANRKSAKSEEHPHQYS